ncbi:FAD-dependent oxidoreductase [Vreelandella olivaria]|uniref:FAD-dependent oxidoreductase n=1 Tax=Vreelandella olivaria TaxID=390919 RepID=UPI00201EAA6D|nr:FAD-dependent oxidoreductase [Halomonas olivaria]
MTTSADRPYRRYLCIVCGFIYDESQGDPDGGLPPGTRYEDIPDDWECPDCGVRKQDFVLLTTESPSGAATMQPATPSSALPNEAEQIVIVGGGMAAWTLVESIRQRDNSVPIVVVSRCSSEIYYKPQLSAAAATGQSPDDLVIASGEHQANRLNVTLVAHTRVLGIDRANRRLITPRGGLPYRYLVLAVGAHQPKPILSGNASHQVVQVNDLTDYRLLRKQLDAHPSARVVILGAGLIGCEFADDLSGAGHAVSLIDMAAHPLARLLPTGLSQRLAEQFQHRGITLYTETTLETVEQYDGGSLRVTLANGQCLYADAVISALGLTPNVALALQAGLKANKGVVADTQLRTSDRHIFALGDCVEHQAQLLPFIKPLKAQASVLGALLCGENTHYSGIPSTIIIKTPCYPIAVWPPQEQGEWVEHVANKEGATFLHYSRDSAGQQRLTGFALAGPYTREVRHFEAQLSQVASALRL